MKHISIALLTLLLAIGCSEQNPLQTDGTKESLESIPQAPKEVPFHADLHNTIEAVPPFPPPYINAIFEGGGNATHLGEFVLFSTSQVDVTVIPNLQTGTAVLTAGDGDELHFDYAGTATPADPQGFLSFSGDFVFIGGTGRFGNATGAGTYAGTANVIAAMGQWEMDGMISR